jgi:hypothetical protein
MDKVGDAFTDQANSMRPMNVAQRQEQALLRGLGAGFGLNPQREGQLAELENMSKELTMFDHELKMQSGENELKKQKDIAFFNKTRNDLSVMSDFANKSDNEAVKFMLPTFLEKYEELYGENAGRLVDFHDGNVYLEKDGKVQIQRLADLADHIIPENEKANFTGLLTYNSKAAVQNKLEEQRLKNEQIRAAIEASRASVESSKAHTELYKSQVENIAMEAQNPMSKEEKKSEIKRDENLSINIHNSNIKFLEEAVPKIKTNKTLIKAYKKLDSILEEEENSLNNRSGPGGFSKLYRLINSQAVEKFTSSNSSNSSRRQHLIELEKEPLWREFKEIFGAKGSDQDLIAFLKTMPDLNNPYEANKEAIAGRIARFEEENFILENTIDRIEKNNYKIHYSHISFIKEIDDLNEKRFKIRRWF